MFQFVAGSGLVRQQALAHSDLFLQPSFAKCCLCLVLISIKTILRVLLLHFIV